MQQSSPRPTPADYHSSSGGTTTALSEARRPAGIALTSPPHMGQPSCGGSTRNTCPHSVHWEGRPPTKEVLPSLGGRLFPPEWRRMLSPLYQAHKAASDRSGRAGCCQRCQYSSDSSLSVERALSVETLVPATLNTSIVKTQLYKPVSRIHSQKHRGVNAQRSTLNLNAPAILPLGRSRLRADRGRCSLWVPTPGRRPSE